MANFVSVFHYNHKYIAIAERPARRCVSVEMLAYCCPTVVRITQRDRVSAWGTLSTSATFYSATRRSIVPRDTMLARYMLSSCVCLSRWLSHAGIVPKWLNIGSSKQRRSILRGLDFWRQRSRRNSIGVTPGAPTGSPNAGGVALQSAILG